MRKGFLAGPMSGIPDWNRPEFERFRDAFRGSVSMVTCFDEGVWLDRRTDEDIEAWHRRCLGSCIRALSECDTLYLMPGWEKSLGCRIEFQFATAMNMDIVLL